MQNIETYIVLACIIWIWAELILEPVLKTKDYLGRITYRNKYFKLIDRKPINCGTCLSFWIGLLFFLITFKILFLTLPIAYKLIHKHI